jgi:hypothetical protein
LGISRPADAGQEDSQHSGQHDSQLAHMFPPGASTCARRPNKKSFWCPAPASRTQSLAMKSL